MLDNGEGIKRGQVRYGSAVMNFDESQVKRDEDGKFMGKTKSGKDVYSKFEHPSHAGFDSSDHKDATWLHDEKRTEYEKAGDSAQAAEHDAQLGKHSTKKMELERSEAKAAKEKRAAEKSAKPKKSDDFPEYGSPAYEERERAERVKELKKRMKAMKTVVG